MEDERTPTNDVDDTVIAERSPASDETVIADRDSTRLVRREGAPTSAVRELGPAPSGVAAGRVRSPAQPSKVLLERHLGPPPPGRSVPSAHREDLPSLRRRERRFRSLALLGLCLTILGSGLGLWLVWQLW